MSSAAVIAMPSRRAQVSPEEWQTRVDLAAAYRLVAMFKWDDLVFTHISARVPGPDEHFLINPYGLMFEEITASSLIKVDTEGQPLMETPFATNPAGFVIHSAIHLAREDAQAVMHLHTPYGQAVSSHADGLLPITQTAMTIREELAYHDYEGIAVDYAERESLVDDLGDKNAMLLRNHGTLAVGETIGEAFLRLYILERACEAQVLALSGGVAINQPRQGVPEVTAEQARAGLRNIVGPLAWPALLRKAERLDPNFAN
jgi:ribulose-5-phosphate 4-epimerase/fuculose-1-phosphate aldolase